MFKTIKNDQFFIDCQLSWTIQQVKNQIQSEKGFLEQNQKIIFKGTVLSDQKTLQSYNMTENDFCVIIIAKTQAQPSYNQQSEQNNQTQQQIQAQQMQQNLLNQNANLQQEQLIQQIMIMGFERKQVERALISAYNNPDRAVEFLLNGVPEIPQDMQQNLGQPQNSIQQQMNDFTNDPQFNQMIQQIQQNPQMLGSAMQQLQEQNPQMFNIINEHPQEFMSLILQNNQQNQQQTNNNQIMVQDQQAIGRLVDLGFERNLVEQAYLLCNKDESSTANYLFDTQ